MLTPRFFIRRSWASTMPGLANLLRCVVLKPGSTLDLETVVGFLKGQVADYKLPEMIEFYDELPFTPTGKIRRHVLTADVLRRIRARQSEAS